MKNFYFLNIKHLGFYESFIFINYKMSVSTGNGILSESSSLAKRNRPKGI